MYPFPSSFEIPFAPQLQYETKEQVIDPIINGSIYYKFALSNNYNFGSFEGTFGEGTDLTTFFLDPNQNPYYPDKKDFFKGYYITIAPLYNTSLIIRSFDPSSGKVTLNIPWEDLSNPPSQGVKYYMYTNIPNKYYINIPTIDINGNTVLNYELAYNGYYVVFESYNLNYSNQYNSNIYFRKISYYDYKTQNAYFEEPLNFSYDSAPIINFFTLRKSLPTERWTIKTPTYINSIPPENPSIGPQIGPVITLPEGASNIDNFYKGKYVYNYSDNYQTQNMPYISYDFFYPIYGIYYIKSYNASTRELSISQDVNYIKSCIDKNDIQLLSLPSSKILNTQLTPEDDFSYISETSPGTFRAFFNTQSSIYLLGKLLFSSNNIKSGQKYTIKWNVRKSSNIVLSSFKLFGTLEQYIVNDIFDYEQLFTFEITTNPFYNENIGFEISSFIFIGSGPFYIEWNFFEIKEFDTINICDFLKDNFCPLDYNGSTTSQENTSCYNISLSSITLPNISLLYGSKISFYPYVYVVISNTTSPSKASEDLIYSNNPHSDKAVFIAPVGLQVNPNTGTFLSLYSNMTQTIKFKPNDNLKFEVYLPDGSLFKTLLNDTYTPYEPDPRIQIEAVFSITNM
jgi:hypothetical protein